jgi:hypothetical protein
MAVVSNLLLRTLRVAGARMYEGIVSIFKPCPVSSKPGDRGGAHFAACCKTSAGSILPHWSGDAALKFTRWLVVDTSRDEIGGHGIECPRYWLSFCQ